MDIVIVSCLVAAGIGLIAGGHTSTIGLIVASNLLFVAGLVTALVTGTALLLALAWAAVVVLAFNLGFVIGLVVRSTASAANARNLHKTLLDR